jgi:hypothetical protein
MLRLYLANLCISPSARLPCLSLENRAGGYAKSFFVSVVYEEIAFNVPKSYARATVDELPEFGRKLVNAAADAFIQEVRPEGK